MHLGSLYKYGVCVCVGGWVGGWVMHCGCGWMHCGGMGNLYKYGMWCVCGGGGGLRLSTVHASFCSNDVLREDRVEGDPVRADRSNFLHPVLYYYSKPPPIGRYTVRYTVTLETRQQVEEMASLGSEMHL